MSITTNVHEILKKNIYPASLLSESVSWNMAVKWMVKCNIPAVEAAVISVNHFGKTNQSGWPEIQLTFKLWTTQTHI